MICFSTQMGTSASTDSTTTTTTKMMIAGRNGRAKVSTRRAVRRFSLAPATLSASVFIIMCIEAGGRMAPSGYGRGRRTRRPLHAPTGAPWAPV